MDLLEGRLWEYAGGRGGEKKSVRPVAGSLVATQDGAGERRFPQALATSLPSAISHPHLHGGRAFQKWVKGYLQGTGWV